MLPFSFHQTFIPERRYITSLLEYSRTENEGSIHDIAETTGIPMGKSSGKTPAIVDYAKGMGLVSVEEIGSKKRISLTPFGELVLKRDKFIDETITQWLLHINLCNNLTGASAWNVAFGMGTTLIGSPFTRPALENLLISYLGPSRDPVGPLIQTYVEPAAFGNALIVEADGKQIHRRAAPILDMYTNAYAAVILQLFETYFDGVNQVTLDDFNSRTQLFDICYWSAFDFETLLLSIQAIGHISVDRTMMPWILEKHTDADLVWPEIYNQLI